MTKETSEKAIGSTSGCSSSPCIPKVIEKPAGAFNKEPELRRVDQTSLKSEVNLAD